MIEYLPVHVTATTARHYSIDWAGMKVGLGVLHGAASSSSADVDLPLSLEQFVTKQ